MVNAKVKTPLMLTPPVGVSRHYKLCTRDRAELNKRERERESKGTRNEAEKSNCLSLSPNVG
jgi:hypothetical protein